MAAVSIGLSYQALLMTAPPGFGTIKQLGSLALIQHPENSFSSQMPVNASQFLKVDYSIPAAQMLALHAKLTTRPKKAKPRITKKELALLQTEIIIVIRDNVFGMEIIKMKELTSFTCSECNVALNQLRKDKFFRFRCHTEHAYTISSLLSQVTDNVETIFWQAMQALEGTTMLLTKVAEYLESRKQDESARLFYKKAAAINNVLRWYMILF